MSLFLNKGLLMKLKRKMYGHFVTLIKFNIEYNPQKTGTTRNFRNISYAKYENLVDEGLL